MSYFDSQKYYNGLSTVFLPPDYWCGNSYCCAWGQVDPFEWYKTLELEKVITENQIKDCSNRWKDLKKDNLPMRMMISGNLVGLHDDFLDPFINDTMEKLPQSFKIARLVGDDMGCYGFMLGDMQIFSRIKRLIVRGELVLEEEWQDSPMATMVRRK